MGGAGLRVTLRPQERDHLAEDPAIPAALRGDAVHDFREAAGIGRSADHEDRPAHDLLLDGAVSALRRLSVLAPRRGDAEDTVKKIPRERGVRSLMEDGMKRRLICAALFLIASVAPAGADDAENVVLAQVRLSTDPGVAAGCARLGRVSDDSVKDLRRKIVRTGGNTGILSFSVQDLSRIYADVFRCAASQAPPPAPPPLPPGVPPPPPGPPPPPPPSAPR
jgi:hypothetical protein